MSSKATTTKFTRFFDARKENALLPPTKLNSTNHPLPVTDLADSGLVQSFDALALSDTKSCSELSFVGGFHPGYVPTDAPPNSPASALPHPANTRHSSPPSTSLFGSPTVPMPTPMTQSLTMQMALLPRDHHGNYSFTVQRPQLSSPVFSTPEVTSAFVTSFTGQVDDPSTSKLRQTSEPPAPFRLRSQETLTSRQCAGITKAGKQCIRRVKSGPALHARIGDEGSISSVEVFCFQHTKELLKPSGYYARKSGTWVKFEDWIPSYLQSDTQVALRVEMEKARSQSDVPGYIYTFEIRDPKEKDTIKLKVGRTVNLVKRIDQWGKQCGSKEQVLRGWYPGIMECGNDHDGSLMKGRVKTSEIGPWCHRMERLIHLELADLTATGVYLHPTWAELGTQVGSSNLPISVTPSAARSEPCGDCGSQHKEIFEFQRLQGGREWEVIVQPVIQKWGAFVKLCV